MTVSYFFLPCPHRIYNRTTVQLVLAGLATCANWHHKHMLVMLQ